MASHINYNLNVNQDFVMFLTSKLITWFIDGFTCGMKSRYLIAYLLIRNAHIYWILGFEGEVGRRGQQFLVGLRKSLQIYWLPQPIFASPYKFVGGTLMSAIRNLGEWVLNGYFYRSS